VPPEHDGDRLDIVVAHRCYVRVVAPAERDLSWFAVLDPSGRELQLTTRHSGGSTSSNRARLARGKSTVLSVAENGTTAVFFGADRKEVLRLPLRLAPGEVAELRP
jgi:hypothetical protein